MRLCWRDPNVGNHLHIMHGRRGVPLRVFLTRPIWSIHWLLGGFDHIGDD